MVRFHLVKKYVSEDSIGPLNLVVEYDPAWIVAYGVHTGDRNNGTTYIRLDDDDVTIVRESFAQVDAIMAAAVGTSDLGSSL